jgi:hypothetical protein
MKRHEFAVSTLNFASSSAYSVSPRTGRLSRMVGVAPTPFSSNHAAHLYLEPGSVKQISAQAGIRGGSS